MFFHFAASFLTLALEENFCFADVARRQSVRCVKQSYGGNGALDVFKNDLPTPIILELVCSLGDAKTCQTMDTG